MFEKIIKVNALLKAQGSQIIQRIQIGNKPVMHGYRPQYVLDAINEIFGPQNWYYKLHDTELFATGDDDQSGQIVSSVEVFIRTSEEAEFVSHGVQFGQSQIVHGNVGDAKKGAVTNAVLKGLSLFSIGNAAYRGELGAVYGNDSNQQTSSPRSQLQTLLNPNRQEHEASPPENRNDTNGLPKLPNVHYETDKNGVILALGDTYNNRPLLKSMGFRWLPQEKAWGLQQAA